MKGGVCVGGVMLPPLLQVKCDLRPRHLGFLRRVLLLAAVGSENIITTLVSGGVWLQRGEESRHDCIRRLVSVK